MNLDITPHLLPNGEIGIHASIEISSVQAPVLIGGLAEPTFGQRRVEHDIRLKEGEVSLLGGLLQSQVTRNFAVFPDSPKSPSWAVCSLAKMWSAQRQKYW